MSRLSFVTPFIFCCSIKAGTGKCSVLTNLSIFLNNAGQKVAIVDLDNKHPHKLRSSFPSLVKINSYNDLHTLLQGPLSGDSKYQKNFYFSDDTEIAYFPAHKLKSPNLLFSDTTLRDFFIQAKACYDFILINFPHGTESCSIASNLLAQTHYWLNNLLCIIVSETNFRSLDQFDDLLLSTPNLQHQLQRNTVLLFNKVPNAEDKRELSEEHLDANEVGQIFNFPFQQINSLSQEYYQQRFEDRPIVLYANSLMYQNTSILYRMLSKMGQNLPDSLTSDISDKFAPCLDGFLLDKLTPYIDLIHKATASKFFLSPHSVQVFLEESPNSFRILIRISNQNNLILGIETRIIEYKFDSSKVVYSDVPKLSLQSIALPLEIKFVDRSIKLTISQKPIYSFDDRTLWEHIFDDMRAQFQIDLVKDDYPAVKEFVIEPQMADIPSLSSIFGFISRRKTFISQKFANKKTQISSIQALPTPESMAIKKESSTGFSFKTFNYKKDFISSLKECKTMLVNDNFHNMPYKHEPKLNIFDNIPDIFAEKFDLYDLYFDLILPDFSELFVNILSVDLPLSKPKVALPKYQFNLQILEQTLTIMAKKIEQLPAKDCEDLSKNDAIKMPKLYFTHLDEKDLIKTTNYLHNVEPFEQAKATEKLNLILNPVLPVTQKALDTKQPDIFYELKPCLIKASYTKLKTNFLSNYKAGAFDYNEFNFFVLRQKLTISIEMLSYAFEDSVLYAQYTSVAAHKSTGATYVPSVRTVFKLPYKDFPESATRVPITTARKQPLPYRFTSYITQKHKSVRYLSKIKISSANDILPVYYKHEYLNDFLDAVSPRAYSSDNLIDEFRKNGKFKAIEHKMQSVKTIYSQATEGNLAYYIPPIGEVPSPAYTDAKLRYSKYRPIRKVKIPRQAIPQLFTQIINTYFKLASKAIFTDLALAQQKLPFETRTWQKTNEKYKYFRHVKNTLTLNRIAQSIIDARPESSHIQGNYKALYFYDYSPATQVSYSSVSMSPIRLKHKQDEQFNFYSLDCNKFIELLQGKSLINYFYAPTYSFYQFPEDFKTAFKYDSLKSKSQKYKTKKPTLPSFAANLTIHQLSISRLKYDKMLYDHLKKVLTLHYLKPLSFSYANLNPIARNKNVMVYRSRGLRSKSPYPLNLMLVPQKMMIKMPILRNQFTIRNIRLRDYLAMVRQTSQKFNEISKRLGA